MNGNKPKSKSDRSGLVVALIAILLVAGAIYFVMAPIAYKAQFETYKNDLTRSMNHAKENGGITVTRGTDSHIIDEGAASWVYSLIVNMGIGKKTRHTPEETIVLSFPDGAEMILGDILVESGARKGREGLYVSFTNPEGKVFSYYSDLANMKSFDGI